MNSRLLALAPACLLVLSIAGCNAAPPRSDTPEWLIGKYHYSGNGRVAKKFPWDAKADLLLDKDGQYNMTVTVHIEDDNGGDTDNEDNYGTYYVSGDKLILQPANQDDVDETYEFLIQGKKLIPKLPWVARAAIKGFKIPDPVFTKTE